MLSAGIRRRLAAYSVVTAIFGSGQAVLAHTTIKDSSVTEGTGVFTAFSIPHGCGTATDLDRPVIAQVAVFPNGNEVIAFRTDTKEPVDLSTVVVGGVSGAGLIGLSPALIQDNSIYTRLRERTDASERVRAFRWDLGELQHDLLGLVPFRVTAPRILSTSCVNKLIVRVGVSNWCTKNQTGMGRADVWIGRLTPLFDDPAVVSVGFWPTLTVNRDLNKNPLDPSCGGVGFDVEIQPTDADIDGFLPLKGYWPTP